MRTMRQTKKLKKRKNKNNKKKKDQKSPTAPASNTGLGRLAMLLADPRPQSEARGTADQKEDAEYYREGDDVANTFRFKINTS